MTSQGFYFQYSASKKKKKFPLGSLSSSAMKELNWDSWRQETAQFPITIPFTVLLLEKYHLIVIP